MTHVEETVESVMYRLMRIFLVHSFLYYKLDESIVEDHWFDKRCDELNKMMCDHPEVAKSLKYYDLCEELGESGSGSHIKDYPPEIITIALRLLWHYKKESPTFNESFEGFISRWGFHLEK